MYDLLDARILDRNAIYYNVDMEKLMENAGAAVANFASKLGNKFLVIVGPGNNGGDGYVAAKNLKMMKKDVQIKILLEPESPLAIKKKHECEKIGIPFYNSENYNEFDVIIDALLGIGIKGIPREPYFSEINRINQSRALKVSVDVPSGFPSDHSVKADFTVTMQFMKKGMNESRCGKIIVVDVGFPPETIYNIGPGEMLAFPKNSPDSHKGDNGILIAVAGSAEYYGSAVYTVKSALRMGVDLVYLFTPVMAANRISPHVYDVIIRDSGREYFEIRADLLNMIEKKNVGVAIGPGLSKNKVALENAKNVIHFSLANKRPIVIDADPLIISKDFNYEGLGVLTPHHGEFRNSFDLDPTEENAKKIAKDINAVIFLKGKVDIITDGYRTKYNKEFHHESMTRGGTGDLLTGSIGGLLSRGVDPYHAACLASYIVGKSGLLAFKKLGYSYYTSEILDNYSIVMNEK